MPDNSRFELERKLNLTDAVRFDIDNDLISVEYRYDETPVKVYVCTYPDKTFDLVFIIADAFNKLPELHGSNKDHVDPDLVTEFIRQELRLYYESKHYSIFPSQGGFQKWGVPEDFPDSIQTLIEDSSLDPEQYFTVVVVDSAAGVTVRDLTDDVLVEIVPPATTQEYDEDR